MKLLFHLMQSYISFQPMIETINQYNVGMKEPTLHEIRVTNLKKELTLTKRFDEGSYGGMEKNGCSIMLNG